MKALLSKARFTINTDEKRSGVEFLTQNYGGIEPALADLLRPKVLTLSKASFAPRVLGNAIGSVDFEKNGKAETFGPELEALVGAILETCQVIAQQEGVDSVYIHLDELDQGLAQLDSSRQELFIGLVLATRSIKDSSYANFLAPIAYMRTDIWEQLSFSDKNKINRSTALRLEWNPDSLLELINVRIRSKLGAEASWSDLDDGGKMRGSQTKWNHIVARTFMRPRDVIQFCNSALASAKSRSSSASQFLNQDIIAAREDYSPYLKEELDDEVIPHWKKWDEALQAIASMSTITFDRSDFEQAYNARKSKNNDLDAAEALQRLYDFSVIAYRGGIGYGGSKWIYRYLEPQAGWDSAASSFKVHAGLKEYAKLQEERSGVY